MQLICSNSGVQQFFRSFQAVVKNCSRKLPFNWYNLCI